MDFEFTWEQQEVKATAERLSKQEIEPLLASYDSEKPLPREACMKLLQLFEQLGVLGARVPIEYGGTGWGAVGLGIFAESFPYDAFVYGYSAEVVATRLCLGGNEQLKRKFLPKILAGEKLCSSAASEAGAGSDLQGIETRAELVGDEYVINGRKFWVSAGATMCDLLFVIAATGKDERGRKILTPFLLEKEISPFTAHPLQMMGHTQSPLCEVVLNDCRVPKENVLSEATGHAVKLLTTSWLAQRPVVGLFGLYNAKKALEACIEHVKVRKQFGKAIGSFQLVQGRLAEMATLVEAGRLLCYQALSMVDKGKWCRKEASMAKWFADEAAVKVTSMAIEIFGSYGLSREYPLEKYFRDARMWTIPDGTTDINKLIVGREIVGISAFV